VQCQILIPVVKAGREMIVVDPKMALGVAEITTSRSTVQVQESPEITAATMSLMIAAEVAEEVLTLKIVDVESRP